MTNSQLFTADNVSEMISNTNEFAKVSIITENDIEVETEETVMVEIYQHKETERIFVRVYETDEVTEHEDIETAMQAATQMAYDYLVA